MKRLRGAGAFADAVCGECGAAWRPREEVGGYRLHERLARGGFSLVFQASAPAGGGAVAVKIFALSPGTTVEDLARFQADVRILAAQGHPRWLQVFGGGAEEDFAWVAMEWLPLGSLARCGKVGEIEALEKAVQIADAMVEARARGLRHGHLQIGECLLADARTMKVSGFAEAIFYERAGRELGTVWGRLSCAPPERLVEAEEDARSEIYTLGAILFQMLAGELPYEGEVLPELLAERLDNASPIGLPHGMRESTAALVERMMAVEPDARFASWEEVRAGLQNEIALLAPAPVVLPAVPTVSSAAGRAWFTILMLAGMAGFAGWFGWKHFHEPTVEVAAFELRVVEVSTPAPVATPKPAPKAGMLAAQKPSKPRGKSAPEKKAEKMDWRGWKKFALDPAGAVGEGGPQPEGTTIHFPVNPKENVFFARELEGDWRLAARVSRNDGLAGIVARESIGSDRPCVGLVVAADGALKSVIRREAGAKLAITPVEAASRWIRIVRKGGMVSAYHSPDGQKWEEAATLNLASLPVKMPAGFVVWSGSKEKLEEATFAEVALSLGK